MKTPQIQGEDECISIATLCSNSGANNGSPTSLVNVPANVSILPIADAGKVLNIKLKTLRDIRYHSQNRQNAKGEVVQGNGFAAAFIPLGRSVYVDVDAFVTIWRTHAQGATK